MGTVCGNATPLSPQIKISGWNSEALEKSETDESVNCPSGCGDGEDRMM